jgi:ABC-type glycerol-3-phosphate transport system substrate-binding protein
MKKRSRVLAMLLAATMVAGVAGCGGNSTAGGNAGTASDNGGAVSDNGGSVADSGSEASEVSDAGDDSGDEVGQYTVLKDENGNTYDLGGMEIIIADWWSSGEDEEITSAYDEAHQDYLDWIQETYNFTIKQLATTSWGDSPQDYANYATTGGDENYVFVLYQGSALTSAVNSGLMYDLSTLDCLDFSESKWDTSVKAALTKGDAIYGMRGIPHEATAGIYFNKRLLEEAGIDPQTIYDMQANNEWTWDAFEELCQKVQKDTDNDGVIDQYAMTNFSSTFYPAAVYSNGGQFIGKDADGKFYNDLESDATMEALNWALDMIDKYEMVYPEDAAWDYTYTAFQNGEAAFTCAESYKAGDWKDMEDDFGFVCFPMGPRMDTYTNYAQDNVYVIPSCYDEEKAWKIAFAFNLYTEPVPGYEDYPAWKASYYSNFRDAESVDETMEYMVENSSPMFEKWVNGIEMGSDLYWGISKENTPAQKAEEIRNTWQAYIDEANK